MMYWIIVYFDENDRYMSERRMLVKMLRDIRSKTRVTWTPIDPGHPQPYTYPVLVVTLENTLEELFKTAEIVVETYIEEYATKGAPFRKGHIFPPA